MTEPGVTDRIDLLGLDRSALAALCRVWVE
jgi:hypothetical protein